VFKVAGVIRGSGKAACHLQKTKNKKQKKLQECEKWLPLYAAVGQLHVVFGHGDMLPVCFFF